MNYFKDLTLKGLFMAAIVSFTFMSCSDDDSNGTGEGTASLTVRMTDAPGDYDAVHVDVQDVQIKIEGVTEGEVEGEVEGDGWVSLENVQTGVYDLLTLTGGVTQMLADTEVSAGYVSEMRLILGTENSVTVNGEKKPLNTPSAQQSGLKLKINQDFEAGENYAYILDFDVDESIVTTGNGGYILKPVIRVNAEANAGVVVGTVIDPVGLETNIQHTVSLTGEGVNISAYTDSEGNFSLNGVPAGTYDLVVTPEADAGISVFTITDVEVEPNATTDLGEIEL
ncbi:DUF4382 domain-containing protein [Gramella sp. GC03-9]|uniref:DUF4382 domain-containing protein n=1 Tax=Christiangramia oceanisediminis TaxID=2920386 RepID=A0A9X2I818_9FLAO|nr:DUF4382 domain-containing protein [Gramella oceanisediminis]MCP9199176.1 DUF4382 domain-containing protein [Gramella oceanisediminis]